MSILPGILLVLACAGLGTLFVWLWARGATANHRAVAARQSERLAELEKQLHAAQAKIEDADMRLAQRDKELGDARVGEAKALAEVESLRGQLTGLRGELVEARADQTGLLDERQRLAAELAGAQTALEKEQQNAAQRLQDLKDAREQLSDHFRALANNILEEKSKAFTEQNKASLGTLLDPLKVQLSDFKGTVERVYVEEGEKRIALAEQVKMLAELNSRLSDDANNLTRALKGSSKTQGNWGEMVLERILEAGGLRRDHEYRVQESHTREDGSRVVPDVILHLPEGRHLVIDAKASLLDYHEHVNSEAETERELAALRHIASVRAHIKGLAEKDYRSLHRLQTVDFVIMFVPIEPAFMLAIGRDANLWQHAWEKNVLLVSPSTLLFVVRTVSHLWKQEQQRDNVKEIARQGGVLYDKFSSFVADMSKLGEQLGRARESYDSAFNKLSSGRGNLVNGAKKLAKLGVKVAKPLPESLVLSATEDDEEADDGRSPAAMGAPFRPEVLRSDPRDQGEASEAMARLMLLDPAAAGTVPVRIDRMAASSIDPKASASLADDSDSTEGTRSWFSQPS